MRNIIYEYNFIRKHSYRIKCYIKTISDTQGLLYTDFTPPTFNRDLSRNLETLRHPTNPS